MKPVVFDVQGLRLRTPLGLSASVAEGEDFDVDILVGPPATVPHHRPAGGRLVAATMEADDRYRFVAVEHGGVTTLRVPGLCDFVIGPLPSRVECRPDPSADLGLVAILVTGLLVAYLLTLDGHCVLHASAVEVDGVAVAFLGRSGMGKSTMATLCCAAGARLVTDDVLRLDATSGVRCVGGSPHLRLRPHGAWALERFDAPPSTAMTVDGRVAVTPAAATAHPPLGAIVILRPSRALEAVAVRPLGGAAAFVQVMAHARVLGWQDTEVRRRLFGSVAGVVDEVAVLEADIPWGPSADTSVARALLELVGCRR